MHRGSASTASVADDSSQKSTYTANGEQVVIAASPMLCAASIRYRKAARMPGTKIDTRLIAAPAKPFGGQRYVTRPMNPSS
jgi:hypothetical protein